jgi:hypothetical protein
MSLYPPRPRWKDVSMEVEVTDAGGQYVATFTFRYPGVDTLVQKVQGRSYREFAEKLDKLPSPYFLHGRQLLWRELVEAGKDFERLKEYADELIRTGATEEGAALGLGIAVGRWSRFKSHGPKKKREERKARIAALPRQKPKDLWDLLQSARNSDG